MITRKNIPSSMIFNDIGHKNELNMCKKCLQYYQFVFHPSHGYSKIKIRFSYTKLIKHWILDMVSICRKNNTKIQRKKSLRFIYGKIRNSQLHLQYGVHERKYFQTSKTCISSIFIFFYI